MAVTEKINCFFVGHGIDNMRFPKPETILEDLADRKDDDAMLVSVGMIRSIFKRLDALEKKPNSIWEHGEGAFYRG